MNKKLRSFIIAPPGKLLIHCDLSQAETWVVAYLAREETMKWALLNSDIHYETANSIFTVGIDSNTYLTKEDRAIEFAKLITKDQRFTAKKINHATSYRMKPPKFAQSYNAEADIPISIPQARIYQDLWFGLYTGIKPWWNELDIALASNRTIITPYGRKRTFYGQWGDELLKQATAHIPQSTVADHFNGFIQYAGSNKPGGLKEVHRRFKDNSSTRIINQSHDSLMMEVPKESALDILHEVKAILYRPIIINGEVCNIPVDGEIGERWGELKAAN